MTTIDEMEQILELMREAVEIKKKLNDREEDDNEKMELDEIGQSLEKDYEDFYAWCFGSKKEKLSMEKATKVWKERHPDLPLPRVFQSKCEFGLAITIMCLLMDAYHHFKAEKKKGCCC
jgi:hypothetical protein